MIWNKVGPDEKIVAVPTDDLHLFHTDVRSYRDLPGILLKQIEYFFRHYRDLKQSMGTKLGNWRGSGDAERLIQNASARAKTR